MIFKKIIILILLMIIISNTYVFSDNSFPIQESNINQSIMENSFINSQHPHNIHGKYTQNNKLFRLILFLVLFITVLSIWIPDNFKNQFTIRNGKNITKILSIILVILLLFYFY